ncbi:MAG: mechanosensitive ion channel [Desulfuromonadaceae bacterium]
MLKETLQAIVEQFSFLRLLLAVLFFLATMGFVRVLRFGSEKLTEKFVRHRLFISSIYPVLRLLIWIGAISIIIFGIFNPTLNTIIAISASAGLAVGLGAQDLIKNIIAGILILLDRPFRVGDMIQVGDHYGEVTNIGLYSIRLQTFGDSTVNLPNAMALGQAIANSNSGDLDEMVEITFSLPAHLDLQQIRDLAYESATSSPYVFLKKPIKVMIEDQFDRTFLTRLTVKVYVLDIRYEKLLASDISQRFKQALLDRQLLSENTVLGILASA